MPIIVYNKNLETHDGLNNYKIHRPYILGNPYTEIWDRKTLAIYRVRSREEALERYACYFDMMYKSDSRFRMVVDDIYEKYKKGETVYLECYCHPKPCHGDVIKEKLTQRLIKEKLAELKENEK